MNKDIDDLIHLIENMLSTSRSTIELKVKKILRDSPVPVLKLKGSGRYGYPNIIQGGYVLQINPNIGIIKIDFNNGDFSRGKKEIEWMNIISSKLYAEGIEHTCIVQDYSIEIQYVTNIL